ncbi:hypothetical protein [Treponema brennaborense]|nr:hypothetical protein [Treponema brennaborense]
MAELGKPGYDKRLWDDSGSWLKAPTLREVTEIALEVVGSATGQQWWLGYVDDALFAGMDLGGGYKTVEQIGNELGKKALTQAVNRGVGSVTKWAGNAAGTALSKSGKAANIFAQVGISAAGSYAGSVANNYVNALDLSKLGTKEWMDWEAGNAGWTSAGSVSGALSAGIRSGMGSAFGTMGAATNKFYGGAMNLATSAATQAATYGTYLAFNGGNFGAAYEAMGGITLNVANLGSMIDMAGTGIARNNGLGQSRLGSIAQKLSNTGLLEVNIGSNGVTGRIGMGGIDVGGNLYNLAKRMTDKASLEAYKAEYGDAKGNAAYNAYVYGDWTQENTAARLASEIDQLVFSDGSGKSEGWNAQTTSNGSGGRTIEMLNSGNDYNNAITLGHEAYRDGVIGNNQKAETLAATFGHTGMAVRMLQDGANVGVTENLAKDINAYLGGNMDDFLKYVDGNYDSSADYWKVLANGNIVFDGKKDLYDEKGELLKKYEGTGGYTDSLSQMLGISTVEANKLMIAAGYDHYKDGAFYSENKISALLNEDMQIKTTDLFKASYEFQLKYADQVMTTYGGSMDSAVAAYHNDVLMNDIFGGNMLSNSIVASTMMGGLYEFAESYDNVIATYGSVEKNATYESKDAKSAVSAIAESIRSGNYSNDNSVYRAFDSTGILNPVNSPNTAISTYAYYEDGTNHGWGDPRGFAVDIKSYGVEGLPVLTNVAGYLLSNSINSNVPLNLNTGNEIRLFGNNSTIIYGHLQSNASSTTALMELLQKTTNANLWRAYIPSGTQIGNLGNTGHSTGPHLHWEYRTGYQYWNNRSN